MKRREYRTGAYNNYWTVEEYLDGDLKETVIGGLSKKNADMVCKALNSAIYRFCRDNNIEYPEL